MRIVSYSSAPMVAVSLKWIVGGVALRYAQPTAPTRRTA